MKELLKEKISTILSNKYDLNKDIEIEVDFPNNVDFGDYSTNIAMKLAKELKKSPNDIAKEISEELSKDSEFKKYFSEFTNVGGFINAKLSNKYLLSELEQDYKSPKGTGTKILVEYGQPNTHKLPHIGHLFSYIVGDSIARLLDEAGNTVMKANYEGDIGPHVAKSIYGWIQKGKPDPIDSLARVQLLQLCYQKGSKAYKEDPIAKETIDEINKKLYIKDEEYVKIWKETRQWSVDYYSEFEKEMDIQQTYHYWESEVWEKGEATVRENIGKVFKESDGAIIFPGSKYGLHDRVFITQKGTVTYEAKDIGLNKQKYEDWAYDKDIITTAVEQNEYFKVVIKAFESCFPELKGKLEHIGFGMVSLSTGKMSSREGNILSAIDLIEAVKNRVLDVIKSRENITEEEKELAVKNITMGAIKFAFLKQNITQNIKFDIEESISFEGKSGPYIQYTYARIQSILNQIPDQAQATSKDLELLTNKYERELMRWLHRFESIIQESAEKRQPHTLAEYVYELAQKFNSYYGNTGINNADSEELIRARRELSQKVGNYIKLGLNLLGIQTVDKM